MARFTSLAAIVGIAAGVASLIIANALAKGFADEMQDKILQNTAHIAVSMKDGGEIFNWQEISEKIKQIETVENVSPTTYTNSIIIGKTAVSYANLIAKNRKPKTENRIEISIGEKLAEKIGAKTGDEIELVTLQNQSQPKRSNVFVADILKTGIYDYDATWIYISPEDFAFLNERKEFQPTILSVFVQDIYQTNETAEKIKIVVRRQFSNYRLAGSKSAAFCRAQSGKKSFAGDYFADNFYRGFEYYDDACPARQRTKIRHRGFANVRRERENFDFNFFA